MPDRDRIREVFLAAIDLEPEAQAVFVQQECQDDPELRAEVESLLGFHDDSDLVEITVFTDQLETLVIAQPEDEEPTERAKPPGRYREMSELGIGGCGRVTRSWDRVLKRVVAHKQARRSDPVLADMLEHEARLLAWLDHPGAVPVYDGRFDDDGAFYTMRLLDGETLRQHLDVHGRMPIRQAIRVLARVSETMANAHAKGVLHLDLKPANIMLLPYGQVCILDWGVARFHDIEAYRAYLSTMGESDQARVTAYSGIAGTPAYMPVEQAVGEDVSLAADIYACGTILYEMLVGSLPHRTGSNALSVLKKAIDEVTPPRAHRADIPEALEALCLQMIAPEPGDRPPSFDAVLGALDRLNHGAEGLTERTLDTEQVLFRQGDLGHEAFQILEGCLSIQVEGEHGRTEIARRTVGDLVGEMSVVSGSPRSATVVAAEPTRVAVVTGEAIERALETANPLLARMVRTLVDRLRQEAERSRGA